LNRKIFLIAFFVLINITNAFADLKLRITSGMGFSVASQIDKTYNLSVGNSGVALAHKIY